MKFVLDFPYKKIKKQSRKGGGRLDRKRYFETCYASQGRQKKNVKKIQLKYYKSYKNMFIQLLHLFTFTPILIQYAPFGGRNEWIGPVTLRIYDAKRCNNPF